MHFSVSFNDMHGMIALPNFGKKANVYNTRLLFLVNDMNEQNMSVFIIDINAISLGLVSAG